MDINLNQWTPDRIDPHNNGLTVLRNAIPHTNGFTTVREYLPFTEALPEKVVGAGYGRSNDGTVLFFAGTTAGLYLLRVDGSWCNVTPDGVTWVGIDRWDFTQVGSLILASTGTQEMHKYDLATLPGTGCASNRQLFTAIPGTPPQGSILTSFRDFAVVGGIEDYKQRVHWSGYNNAELWETSPLTQSDYQDLPSRSGTVQAVVPGNYGVIFQEKSIHLMTYVGPPVIFRFDEIDRNRGTDSPQSVCWTGNSIFFHASDGFFRLDNGKDLTPIGQDRVDQWFEDSIQNVKNVRGVVDPEYHIVYWSFSRESIDEYDTILLYRWDIDQWGMVELDHDFTTVNISPEETLDSGSFNEFYGSTLDGNVQLPFDSPFWLSGRLNLQIFNREHRLGGLNGETREAVFGTGYRFVGSRRKIHQRRSRIAQVTPIVSAVGAENPNSEQSIRLQLKDEIIQSAPSYDSTSGLNDWGRADFLGSGMYAKITATFKGGFTGFSGFRVYANELGSRGGRI